MSDEQLELHLETEDGEVIRPKEREVKTLVSAGAWPSPLTEDGKIDFPCIKCGSQRSKPTFHDVSPLFLIVADTSKPCSGLDLEEMEDIVPAHFDVKCAVCDYGWVVEAL